MSVRLEMNPARQAESPLWVAAVFGTAVLVVGMLVSWWGFSLGAASEEGLRNPPLWPPGWAFWAVWIFLYPTLGVATWYVWRLREHPAARTVLVIFGVHLLANLSWLPVVHATRSPLVAPVVMDLSVDFFVVAGVLAYARVSRTALLWLVPYVGWNVFTTIIKVWRLWINY